MTFKEAFESNYRFRLPVGAMGSFSWPEGFYWWRTSDDKLSFGSDLINHPRNSIPILVSEIFTEVGIDFIHRTDWYFHPADEHSYNFHKKLIEVINET